MGRLVDELRSHNDIGLDTSIFIYHIEASARYSSLTSLVFQTIADSHLSSFTSVLTLMELQVLPLRLGLEEVAADYDVLVRQLPNVTILDIDRHVARRAAELRARYRVTPADALQVASCIEGGATAFLTNDKGLRRIEHLQVLVLDDYVETE